MQTRGWRMKMRLSALLAATLMTAGASSSDENATSATARQNFVMAATAACMAMEMQKDSPAKCWFSYVNDKPVLVVRFADGEKAATYGPWLLSLVGPQLCAAVKADQRGASLGLFDSKSNRASVYSCETKAFSRWVELDAPVRD